MKLYHFRELTIGHTLLAKQNNKIGERIVGSIDEINNEISPAECQFYDAVKIAGVEQVEVAVVNGLMSIGSPMQVAKTKRMEILLRIAVTDQIKEAINRVGVKPNTTIAGVVVVGDNPEIVVGAITKIVKKLGCEELGVEALDRELENRLPELIKLYGIDTNYLDRIQARSRGEAFKLALFQKISTIRL